LAFFVFTEKSHCKNALANQNFENLKKILHKHGQSPPSEDLFEIQKNIKELADVILRYEEKKKGKIHNTDPPKREK